MADSKPDVLNAALGAAFGQIVPVIGSLVKGLMKARQYPNECKALGEVLDRIQPSLKSISARYKDDSKLEKWLYAFGKCLEDAKVVLQKCRVDSPNILDKLKMMYYGSEVHQLRDRINELKGEAALLLLTSGSSSCGITQEVPKMIFGMEDHFKQVKSSILEAYSGEGSRCVGIRGMGGAGKTLLAQMVNNNKEIQDVFGKDFVIWI